MTRHFRASYTNQSNGFMSAALGQALHWHRNGHSHRRVCKPGAYGQIQHIQAGSISTQRPCSPLLIGLSSGPTASSSLAHSRPVRPAYKSLSSLRRMLPLCFTSFCMFRPDLLSLGAYSFIAAPPCFVLDGFIYHGHSQTGPESPSFSISPEDTFVSCFLFVAGFSLHLIPDWLVSAVRYGEISILLSV